MNNRNTLLGDDYIKYVSSLTLQETLEFLDTQKATAACPSCGNDGATIYTNGDTEDPRSDTVVQLFLPTIHDDMDIKRVQSYSFICAVCQQCGYSRMYSTIVMYKHKKSRENNHE